jgi:regulator of sigma E protease
LRNNKFANHEEREILQQSVPIRDIRGLIPIQSPSFDPFDPSLSMDLLPLLTSSAWSVLMIAVFFGGSIFVHEFGHFWVAKKRGVKVERFSFFGLGPPIFKWRGKDGVEYCVCWIPIGAYVALPQLADMRGIEGEASADTAGLPSPNYTTRMLVFVAGATMNIVLAFALATILWQVGLPANADTQRARIGHVAPTLTLPDGRVVPSPAAEAGLLPGDTIAAIDGQAVSTWDEMRQILFTGDGRTADGRPQTTLTIRRGAEIQILAAKPVLAGDERMRMLGVSPFQELKIAEVNPDSLGAKAGLQIGDIVRRIDDTAITSFATYAAALEARPAASATLEVERAGAAVSLSIPPRTDTVHAAELGLGFDPELVLIHPTPWKQVADTARMTARTFWSLINRDSDVGISKLSGPIGIARVFHITAQADIRYVLWFTILVNVNLAIFNLLPLPVLDGGHMLFATIGRLRGRALPATFIQNIQGAFVVALLSMMIYVSFFDIRRITRSGREDNPAAAPSTPAPPK